MSHLILPNTNEVQFCVRIWIDIILYENVTWF